MAFTETNRKTENKLDFISDPAGIQAKANKCDLYQFLTTERIISVPRFYSLLYILFMIWYLTYPYTTLAKEIIHIQTIVVQINNLLYLIYHMGLLKLGEGIHKKNHSTGQVMHGDWRWYTSTYLCALWENNIDKVPLKMNGVKMSYMHIWVTNLGWG